MLFVELANRLTLSPKRIREWIRIGIVLPISPAQGPGRHSIYDDASLVATAIAEELNGLGVAVGRYRESFASLHDFLRARSSVEWSQFICVLTPSKAEFIDSLSARAVEESAIHVDLQRICVGLMLSEEQQSLNFGLRSI